MNRAERRKAGVKGQKKTYVFNDPKEIVQAALTGVAKEAMEEEIDRQILERADEFEADVDAAILWALHVSCGFGANRLKKFFRDYIQVYREMRERFEDHDCFAERYKLKELGVDVIELRKEVDEDDLL